MFKRLFFDDWVSLFPLAAFVCASVIFGFIIWYALRMKPDQRERLARIPLQD